MPKPSALLHPLVLAGLFCLALLVLPRRLAEPLRDGLTELAPGDDPSARALASGPAAGAEAAALRTRVCALEAEVLALRRQLAEVAQAREAATVAGAFRLLTAPVVADARAASLVEQVTVGRGRLDGVPARGAVLAEGALAGFVTRLQSRRAEVRLLWDASTRVRVRIGRSGVSGVLSGTGPGEPLILRPSEREADIQPGDTVLVDPASTVAPAGIPAGRVVAVEHRPGELLPSVIVEPLAALDDLRTVTIPCERLAAPAAAAAAATGGGGGQEPAGP